MQTQFANERSLNNATPGRCYGCFRPRGDCYCAAIPTIENKTEVFVVQHVRERFHPFNTARIVRKALRNSRLIVDHTPQLAAGLTLKSRAGLLYPGPGATLLSELRADERPEQLVIIDGTWHHAKTLVRDIPALQKLPRYGIAPAEPSRYRIRREPDARFLSTVEATIAALQLLEPDTAGLDQLMAAFVAMVDRQLSHPKSPNGWRHVKRRTKGVGNIPSALLGNPEQIVVAYGESAAREVGREHAPRPPVYWVAERLGTGERFGCAIQPHVPLNDSILGHLELSRADFSQALSLDAARAAWASFLRPGDVLVVYNESVAQLLRFLCGNAVRCLVLKSVKFQSHRRFATLDELLTAEGVTRSPVLHPGRAGKRLAEVLALARHVIALGNVVETAT